MGEYNDKDKKKEEVEKGKRWNKGGLVKYNMLMLEIKNVCREKNT